MNRTCICGRANMLWCIYMSSMFDVHRHTLLGDEQNVYLWTCEYVVVQRAAWMGIASTPPETRIAWKSERT